MTRKHLNIYLLSLLLILAILVAGCGNENAVDTADEVEENEAIEEESELMARYDQAVTDGSMIEENGVVTLVMVIREGIPEEEIIDLAELMAQDLKEDHPDEPVRVHALRDDETVADVSLD